MDNIAKKSENSLAPQLIKYLRNEFVWFETRWNFFDIEHKVFFEKILDKHPEITLHLAGVIRKNIDDEGNIPNELWKCSSQEMELLTMLALPYDESEFVLEDDTGLIDLSGKKILKS